MPEKDMGKKIHELRTSQKLTLEQVANEVGVGRSTVRKWETGMIANMRRDKIEALAKALHTTPEYLMEWSGSEDDSSANSWNAKFRESLQHILLLMDRADARSTGVSLNAYQNIADGDFPLSFETCCNICNVCGASLDEMVGLHGSGNVSTETSISSQVQKNAKMTVGSKIKMMRKSMGLTQTELGEYIGVQKNAVSKWECGRVEDIPMSTIKSLATVFQVPVSYLIGDNTVLSPEAQKIAAAFDKATTKEKQIVRLALSECLDDKEK